MMVETDVRKKWINLLENCFEKNKFNFLKNNLTVCRKIEHFCHTNQKIIEINSIKIYKYGNEQIIFDDEEAHKKAFLNNYFTLIRKFAYIALEGNIENVKYDSPETWIENEKVYEGTEHDAWEKLYFARQENAKMVLSSKEATKGLFTCPKCKSDDVDTDQKQTRSSDEPMTIFCSCNACGKRFIR